MSYARFSPAAIVLACLWASATLAQELTPRVYWPAPKGTSVMAVGYQYSTGDILTDTALPISGVESDSNLLQLSYQHTLDLFGRTGNLQINAPYTWSTTEGFAFGEQRNRSISGFADPKILLAVNLLGAPTMDKAGFQQLRANPRTIIGASVMVQVPVGSYDKDKLLNTGTNRWVVKPEVGLIWPVRPTWLVEVELGVSFFGDNDDFLGLTQEQDPLFATEVHLVKRFKPGFWASLDLNYYVGGRTTLSNGIESDLQRNSRFGGTFVYPFNRRNAFKATYSTGIVTETNGDFDQFGLTYLFIW